MVDQHCVNHQAYPVVHFYTRPRKRDCFSLNIARLDEALTILVHSGKGENLKEEIELLRFTIFHFLEDLKDKFSQNLPLEGPVDPQNLLYHPSGPGLEELRERRRIIASLLKSEGFSWEEVVNKKQG